MTRCCWSSDCPMTAGYYIGAGLWVCWLHAIFYLPPAIIQLQPLRAMPPSRLVLPTVIK